MCLCMCNNEHVCVTSDNFLIKKNMTSHDNNNTFVFETFPAPVRGAT